MPRPRRRGVHFAEERVWYGRAWTLSASWLMLCGKIFAPREGRWTLDSTKVTCPACRDKLATETERALAVPDPVDRWSTG